jgi:hypothetical protein
MTQAEVFWLATTVVTSFGINLAILNFALNDRIRRPIQVGLWLNLAYNLIWGALIYFVVRQSYLIAVSVSIALFFLAVFAYVLKQRDVRGIRFAETIIERLRLVDLQIVFVLSEIARGKRGENSRNLIRKSLTFILSEVEERIVFKSKLKRGRTILSLMLTKADGRFEMAADVRIPANAKQEVERLFRYGETIRGVAGLAATRGAPICVPDVLDAKNSDTKYWVRLPFDEDRTGSVLCCPILRGVGETENIKPLAVLSISSPTKDAFDCEGTYEIIRLFTNKIEELVYLYEMCKGRSS